MIITFTGLLYIILNLWSLCYNIFVDFCKKIADRQSKLSSSDSDGSGREHGSDEDAPFINHPFKIKDNAANIIMNIRVSLILLWNCDGHIKAIGKSKLAYIFLVIYVF